MPALFAACGLLYALAVRRVGRAGRAWPWRRSAAFAAGAALGALPGLTPLGAAAVTSRAVHVVEHSLVGMAAPLLLSLGAPVTLAAAALDRPAQRALVRALHSRPARLATHPLLAGAAFSAGLYLLYLTPLYELSTRSPALHAAVHLHLLAAGCAFCWPLVGVDPTPGRPPHAVRLLAVAAAGPAHAVLGLALLGVDEAAASAVWISGEAFTVTALCLALGQWLAAERRAARRAEALRWGPAA